MSALQVAVYDGDLEKTKRLVVEGAVVEELAVHGFTPLLDAAFRGHTPIINWLLREGGSAWPNGLHPVQAPCWWPLTTVNFLLCSICWRSRKLQ
jgi:hypothetical protein